MKNYWIYAGLSVLLSCHLSCTREVEMPERQPGSDVTISVAPMELQGTLQSRAAFPLPPERENLIKTLALLAFDQEGLHYIGGYDYYAFRPIADAEAPYGKLTVLENGYAGGLPQGTTGTLCAIANMSEEKLLTLLRKQGTSAGRQVIDLATFKQLVVDLPYIHKADSVGLVSDVYMFGYYEGVLNPYPNEKERKINITLGRILTRLDVSLSTEVEGLHYRINLRNTSRKAYIFPGERSPEGTTDDPSFFPVTLSKERVSYYYYVGPHSAANAMEATCLDIFYGTETTSDGTLNWEHESTKHVTVPLCNTPPGAAIPNYDLDRNSIYNISINLVRKQQEQPAGNGITRGNGYEMLPGGVLQVEI